MNSLKKILFFILCLGITASSFSQDQWQGQYHSKRLILSRTANENEPDSLHLNSPENWYDNLPLSVKNIGDSLILENSSFGLRLTTKEMLGDSFQAYFTNYKATYPVCFSRIDSIEPLFFPQHPKGLLPYTSEDVRFNGKHTGITYGGTLVVPAGKEKYPLAVLLNGTGQHDRNYTYAGRQFFTVLADALARKGIASFRMDDRGNGETTGDFQTASIEDFVADLEEAIGFLMMQGKVDTSYLGVIGHSEGGVVASIATAKTPEIRFMVSLAGVSVDGVKILDLQNTAILKAHDIADSLITQQMDLYNRLFRTVYENKEVPDLEAEIETEVRTWMQYKDPATLRALQLADGRDQILIYRFSQQAKTEAYRYMIHYDPKDHLPKIKVPVLALNGGSDIFVPAEENLENFRKYLKTDFTSKIYPGVNHMFQHCVSCTSEETNTLEEVFAPEALIDITSWILQQYKRSSL